jgi:hypothetical protein
LEKPKQPQVIILDGGRHDHRLALFMAAAHQFPARASITVPPPAPAPALEKNKPVLARVGSFLRDPLRFFATPWWSMPDRSWPRQRLLLPAPAAVAAAR